jgi:hypothetical protein
MGRLSKPHFSAKAGYVLRADKLPERNGETLFLNIVDYKWIL